MAGRDVVLFTDYAEGYGMKGRILNHLDAADRERIVWALETTLDMLPDLERSRAGSGDQGSGFMEFRHRESADRGMREIRIVVASERTVLRHRAVLDGRHRRTTITEAIDGIRDTRGETIEDTSRRIRGWLEDAGRADDEDLIETHRSAERTGFEALLAAACRRNDGWSHACATMEWQASEASIMLDYDDGRPLARFCASGEEPCDGKPSIELQEALRSKTSVRHLVVGRSVFDPGPTFTFGPPPVIRIRSADVSAVGRLIGIADAVEKGYELLPNRHATKGMA